MSEDQQPETVQLNLATEQRNAGRDYHEILVPGSLELWLAMRSGEALDRESIGNEHLFRHRFGINANRAVRQQVLAIKQRYDMTDHDVRCLCRSTQMQINHKEARISPDRVSPTVGWLGFAFLSYFCAGMILLIFNANAPEWKSLLGVSIVAGIWFGCTWVLKSFYIGPWRILKRAGVL